MKHDLLNIEYLKLGNSKQRKLYNVLTAIDLYKLLERYKPIIVGTIPLEIDLPESDVDVICYVPNNGDFEELLLREFGNYFEFEIKSVDYVNPKGVACRFEFSGFKFELFGQNLPTECQDAYLHMVIEYHVLQRESVTFRNKIIELKKAGMKTEPAFATLLQLNGNPYQALIEYGLKMGLLNL